jgi:hypothetical protein
LDASGGQVVSLSSQKTETSDDVIKPQGVVSKVVVPSSANQIGEVAEPTEDEGCPESSFDNQGVDIKGDCEEGDKDALVVEVDDDGNNGDSVAADEEQDE